MMNKRNQFKKVFGIVSEGHNNVFRNMTKKEENEVGVAVVPDVITCNTLIDGFCKVVGRQEKWLVLMDQMRSQYGSSPNAVTYNCLIDGFCKPGEIDRSRELFDHMKEERIPPKGCRGGVYEFLKEMQATGIRPDEDTYNTLIDCLSKSGDFSTARQVLNKMIGEGLKPKVVTYGALIHLHCKDGNFDRAMEIFRKMVSTSKVPPSIVIYNILIFSLCKNNEIEATIDLMEEMDSKGVLPNVITYNAIFRSLSEINRLHTAFLLMDMMNEQSCNPDYITFMILYKWLSAVGEIDKLKRFLKGEKVSVSVS